MRYSKLAHVRANVILFAFSLALTEAIALLLLGVFSRCDALESDTVRLAILVVAFAIWLSVKIEARAAFLRAMSDDEARHAARPLSAWLIQFHIESTRQR
ncbi:hypothetical protein [Caballeronia sp. BR00000012568055]|uniref:hypothetical protein n=1 Tax=Caballeronia sp. BR00000012568055 TaxID=2918761 RepID=UPI0023F93264|nr:hypothetical protein [Caballeronia sp. BR00000012568055]